MNMEISNPMDYKAALYIRLSKEDDNEHESESVSNQKSMLKTFAENQQLDVYDIYIDDGFSGTDFDRPAFQKLLKDIKNKKVNMVITKDMSRLGRDYIQTGFYLERYFPENRVRYISLLDNIDTGTESSMNDITPFKAIMKIGRASCRERVY
jgi:DNA invertase Pin-like site-specific DNA recombinase